jgi:integrase
MFPPRGQTLAAGLPLQRQNAHRRHQGARPARRRQDEQHIVPLSRQALELFEDLRKVTGNGKYSFPSVRTGGRPMSDTTMNAALRRLGYTREEMASHGFCSLAPALLNKLGWNRDAIERQLAHGGRAS